MGEQRDIVERITQPLSFPPASTVGCRMIQLRECDVREAAAEITRLREIVGRLERTADDVPILRGDTVWFWIEDMDGERWQFAEVAHVLSDGTVVWACRDCNERKGCMTMLEFMSGGKAQQEGQCDE